MFTSLISDIIFLYQFAQTRPHNVVHFLVIGRNVRFSIDTMVFSAKLLDIQIYTQKNNMQNQITATTRPTCPNYLATLPR